MMWTLSASAQPADVTKGLEMLEAMQAAFKHAIDQARPSLVSVFVLDRAEMQVSAAAIVSPGKTQTPSSEMFQPRYVGSGIVLDDEGHILTCYHVVRESVDSSRYPLVVQDYKGKSYRAEVFAGDPRSDLASLRLVGAGNIAETGMKPIVVGKGEAAYPGQFVLALGNPFGVAATDGNVSASWGIISNIQRRGLPSDGLPLPWMSPEQTQAANEQKSQSLLVRGTLIQTDARLNMGISGGALINIRGELIGITMALAAAVGYETPGGLALPTDAATRRTIELLRQGREVEYGLIGITFANSRLVGQTSVGAEISEVLKHVPAAHVLQERDVVVAINGQTIRSENDLILEVGGKVPGDVLELEIQRQRSRLTVRVPLAKYPVTGAYASVKPDDWRGLRVDFLSTLYALGGDNRANGFDDRMPFGPRVGVAVRDVLPASPAAEAGLREEMVITAVNGGHVITPAEFAERVAGQDGPVTLTVFGQHENLVIKPRS